MNRSSLSEIPVGVDATVIGVEGVSTAARRLMELGVVPGASVRIVKTAPWGDPLQIVLRGYSLAVRKSEAALILVDAASAERND